MIGKSIINRNSNFDIGMLCLSYGGGGHKNAGTCQLDNDKVDLELPKIIEKMELPLDYCVKWKNYFQKKSTI